MNEKVYKFHIIIIIFFISLLFVLYYPSINAPFVFDDYGIIVNNNKIRNLDNFLKWNIIFSSRPLVDLSFALNYYFGQLNTFGYHLINIIIHIINGILVYFLSQKIFYYTFNINPINQGNTKKNNSHINILHLSFITALIFLIHPLQTQAVSYVVQRYTSMAAFFYLLSIFIFIIIREKQLSDNLHTFINFNKYFFLYILLIFLAFAGFLSKQNVASLPFMILFVEFIFFDRDWKSWKRKLTWIIPLLLIICCLIIYIGLYKGQAVDFGQLLEDISLKARETEKVGRIDYLITQFSVLVKYIRMFMAPYGLNLDHLYGTTRDLFNIRTMASIFFLLALFLIAIYSYKKRPVVCFGIVWFFITISVESSIFPINDALVEHRMYLPSFGFCIITSWLIHSLLKKFIYIKIFVVISIIIGISLATYQRNQVWSDPVLLWSDSVKKNPNNYRAFNNLGEVYLDRKMYDKAEELLKRSISLKEIVPLTHLNLGLAYAHQDKFEKAKKQFQTALALKPGYAKAHFNLASIYQMEGQLSEAKKHLLKAVTNNPSWTKARFKLGEIADKLDDNQLAARQYEKLLSQQPEMVSLLHKLVDIYIELGQFEKSKKYITRILDLNHDSSQAHTDMGFVLMKTGDKDKALKHLNRAIELDPENHRAKSIIIDILYGQN